MTTIQEAAIEVLTTAAADDKARAALDVAARYRAGGLAVGAAPAALPERPARPARPELRPPAAMPKRRKGGNRRARVALLHALAHIELNAIDLAFDIVARFAHEVDNPGFVADWIKVGDDEARHFMLLADRLAAFDAAYGDLPAHDGLWESALNTKDDVLARLAVVPMVLEARGLDVTPAMIERMRAFGDTDSAEALTTIYTDEITHVAAGRRWFDYLCRRRDLKPEATFHDLVRTRFRGQLKPPFNDDARARAGLSGDFYRPLVEG